MTVWITRNMSYVNQASVGFSGVIFTLALMDCYLSTQPTRSLFGFVQVPTRLYPWVLLVLLSVRPDSRAERAQQYTLLLCARFLPGKTSDVEEDHLDHGLFHRW